MARLAVANNIHTADLSDKAAFALGQPARFPIYVRTASTIFQAARNAKRKYPDAESPFTLFLTAIIAHELAHVILQADEPTALRLELDLLQSYKLSGIFNTAVGRLANIDGYLIAVKRQPGSELTDRLLRSAEDHH